LGEGRNGEKGIVNLQIKVEGFGGKIEGVEGLLKREVVSDTFTASLLWLYTTEVMSKCVFICCVCVS